MKVYRTMNLGFGMVSIPVKLYKLTDDASSVSLCQYHIPCGTAVKEPQYCPKCEKLIEKSEIGKAYAEDSKKTKLIPITPEELAYLPLPSKETIQIDGTIEKYPDDRYPDEKYGLEPDDKGKRAFALFEAVLRKSGKMGVAKITLGTKEHLCTVYPTGTGLLYMQTLRWASDLRDLSELKAPEVIITDKEMQMAEMLLGTLPTDVDLASYQNEYGTALRKLVESKKAGITMTGPVAAPVVKDVDLIEQLMASLKQAKVA
jgi:DNA end-binding protein Ku